MHRCNHKTKPCVQVNVLPASETVRASIVDVADEMICDIDSHDEAFAIRTSLIDTSMRTDIHSVGHAFKANICNVSPLLQVTIIPMCGMEEIIPEPEPVEGYFITADGFIFATAEGYIFRPADL